MSQLNQDFIIAGSRGHSQTCRLLLQIGANKKVTDKSGMQAGQLAMQNNFRVTAQTILEYSKKPVEPQVALTYLRNKQDNDESERKQKKEVEKMKAAGHRFVGVMFDSFGAMFSSLLSYIPYFRKRQEKHRQEKIVLEATKKIFQADTKSTSK